MAVTAAEPTRLTVMGREALHAAADMVAVTAEEASVKSGIVDAWDDRLTRNGYDWWRRAISRNVSIDYPGIYGKTRHVIIEHSILSKLLRYLKDQE